MPAALTIPVDEAMLVRVDAAAAERGTTRENVAAMALESFISHENFYRDELDGWQLALIDEGLAAADKGEFATDEEVEAIFSKYRR